MKNLAEQIVTIKAIETIKEICLPLQKIGIHVFVHDITFGAKKVSMLTNNKELFLTYYDHQLPIVCTNEEGRILEEGIYLKNFLEQSYNDCAQVIPVFSKKFHTASSIHLFEKEPDCQHFYTFGSNLEEKDFLHVMINYLDYLKSFLKNYKKLAADIICEAKKPHNQITLPYITAANDREQTLVSYRHLEQKIGISDESHSASLIHKVTNKPVLLSFQQKRCFKLLLQGYSAKEIARNMDLSYRTVQHYVERIRNILDCRSTKELIAHYSMYFDRE